MVRGRVAPRVAVAPDQQTATAQTQSVRASRWRGGNSPQTDCCISEEYGASWTCQGGVPELWV